MRTTFAWCFLLLFLCFIRLSFAESPATRKTKQQVDEVRFAIEHSTKKNNIAHTKKHGSAPLYHHIGCFLNSPGRTLSYSGHSFRSGTWAQRIIQCALVASNGGYNTFGVQHGGNCFTGRSTRNKHGVAASGCKNGLGGTLKSDIYILHTSVGTPKLYLSRMESPARRNNGKKLPCCGNTPYNPQTLQCCLDGQLVPHNYSCTPCGKRFYDENKFICCKGKYRLRRKYGLKTKCCGEKRTRVYNINRNICCGNRLLSKKLYGCCGNVKYRKFTHKCCRQCCGINKIVLRTTPCNTCNGKKYNPRRYICCRKTTLLRRKHGVLTRCCGAGVFNSRKSICCHGTIQPLRYGILTRCCRKKIYNIGLRKCCRNGKNVPRHYTCTTCAGRHYNRKRQICCRSSWGKQTLKSKKFGTKTRCCQNNVYNPERQKCCFSTVHNQPALSSEWKCCGANIYNSNVHKCCRGRIKLPKSYSCVACALRNFYDPRQNICCRGTIYRRRYGLASSCCVKNLYDKKIQRCCSDGTLIPSGKTCSLPLCGKQPYNETSHICCDGHAVFPRIFGSKTGCCVFNSTRSIYHIQQQKCCFGKPILSVEPCFPDGINCTEDMDVSRYICCGEMKQLKLYGDNTDCCGNHVYDRAHELCCDGNPSPIQAGKNYQCCGEYSYDSNAAQCCAGNIVIPKCGTCPTTK